MNFQKLNKESINKIVVDKEYSVGVHLYSDELENFSGTFVLVYISKKDYVLNAWDIFLTHFLNLPQNEFFPQKNIFLYGHLILENEIEKNDVTVFELTKKIILLGKTPIFIGSEPNISFSILKAFGSIFDTKMDIFHISPFQYFGTTKLRTHNNPFGIAFRENYLQKYILWGLQKLYVDQGFLDTLPEQNVYLNYYDNMLYTIESEKNKLIQANLNFLNLNNFGFEINFNSIENCESSANLEIGYSILQIRKWIKKITAQSSPRYLHISEMTFVPHEEAQNMRQSKVLIQFILDFIQK